MKRQPYAIVIVNGKKKLWPYPEAQEFCLYVIPKSSLIYLTNEELKQFENFWEEN